MDRLLRALWRSWPLRILAYVFAWTLPALISATQSMMIYATQGDAAPLSFLFTLTAPTWYAWGLLAPIIYFAARAFPLDQERWGAALPVHLALNALLTVASVALVFGARAVFGLPMMRSVSGELVASINTSLLTYWTIVLIAHAVRYYQDGQARDLREAALATQLSQARLDALRAQLHPHFLFNTLHAISAFVREDPDRAESMLAELGELLRLSIDGSSGEVVALADELAFVERYLAIQKARLGDRLTVRLDVPVDLLRAGVPTLLLQPLVENAVEHGVARRRGQGHVRIGARRLEDQLELTVTDDGPGLAGDKRTPETWRVGLKNTKDRLTQLYGADHGFQLENGEERGLTVRIQLPWRVVPPANPEAEAVAP